jgi:putative transposase
MNRKTFKFRLYVTPAQADKLTEVLDRCRELYNAALEERRAAYQRAGKTLTLHEQQAELPAVKAVRPEYRAIYAQVLQEVIVRLDRAYTAFFRRLQAGQKPGFPRFQGCGRYVSFTYPQFSKSGKLIYSGGRWGRLTLAKLDTFKVRMHRPVEGTIKTVTILRDGDQWYVAFACEVVDVPLPATGKATGVDLGLLHFATLADGRTIDNPRPLRRSLKKLQRAQRRLSRCKAGSHRRVRARRMVARLHRRVRNQRADFCHQQTRRLVREFDIIVFEDLAIANLVQNHHLALSISDAGWRQFIQYTLDKAACAGRRVLFVDPRYTSQQCSGCGAIRAKPLSARWHSCACGTELDRDHNAAINILRLGSSPQAVSVCRSLPR